MRVADNACKVTREDAKGKADLEDEKYKAKIK